MRVFLNGDNKTIGAKIRESTLQKIPYMVIIGEREVAESKIGSASLDKMFVSVRSREGENLGKKTINEFIKLLKAKIEKVY